MNETTNNSNLRQLILAGSTIGLIIATASVAVCNLVLCH